MSKRPENKLRGEHGFTLLEFLITTVIIVVLAVIVLLYTQLGREHARLDRAKADLVSVYQSLELYHEDNGVYPPDANRDVPPGLETYLEGGTWPDAAWPGSVFDWDNWTDPDTGQKIYQISIRFCPIGGPSSLCQFPSEEWAEDFDVNSAVYFCVYGACRAYISELVAYPGYCVNC